MRTSKHFTRLPYICLHHSTYDTTNSQTLFVVSLVCYATHSSFFTINLININPYNYIIQKECQFGNLASLMPNGSL